MKNCMLPMQCYTPTVASETSFSAFTSLYLLLNILSLHVHTIYSYIFTFLTIFSLFSTIFSVRPIIRGYLTISQTDARSQNLPHPFPHRSKPLMLWTLHFHVHGNHMHHSLHREHFQMCITGLVHHRQLQQINLM